MLFLLSGSLRAVLVLVLLTPFAVSFGPLPPTVFPYVVPKAALSLILVEAAFGLWVLVMLRDPSCRPRFSWVMAAAALYLAVQLLAGLLGAAPERSLWSGFERMTGWVHWAHFLVWALMVRSVFRTWRDWRFLLSCAAVVSLFMGLLAFLAQGGWAGWLRPFWPVMDRAAASFGNPAFAGGYAAAAFYSASGLACAGAMRFFRQSSAAGAADAARRRGSGGGPALLWLVAAGLMLMLLWWSGTRGAMLGFGLGAAVFALGCILRPPGRFFRAGGAALAALLAAGALFLAVTLFVGGDAGRTLRDGLRHDRPDSVPERLVLADAAWRGFLDRPLLGRGGGNFSLAYELHAPPEATIDGSTQFDRAHSAPLDELVSGGAAGFACWLLMWTALGWWLIRAVGGFSGWKRVLSLSLAAALAAHFGQSLFLFDTAGLFPQFFLLAAFASFCESRLGAARPSWFRVPRVVRPSAAVLKPSLLVPALAAVLALASAFSVYFVGWRSWSAASAVLPVLDAEASYPESRDALERTAELFPPMAGDARLWFARSVVARWDYLGEEERADALAAVDRHLYPALAADPENHRLAAAMAGAYQRAGAASPARLAEAGELLRRAELQAPNRFEVRFMRAVQAAMEEGPEAGIAAVERYLAEWPGAALRLDDLYYDLTVAETLGLEFGAFWAR